MMKLILRRLRCIFVGHKPVKFSSMEDGAVIKQYDAQARELYRVYLCANCNSMTWFPGEAVEDGDADAMVRMEAEAIGSFIQKWKSYSNSGVVDEDGREVIQ
jgi:hypothetical protein